MSARAVKYTKEQIVEQILLENYERYYRLAYSYVHNDADASDIVQNGAYKAILNCDSLRQEKFAGSWIYRIMLNEIFKYCSKGSVFSYRSAGEKRKVVSFEEMEAEEGQEDVYQDVDLRRALDSLGQKDKAVVELRYFEDMKLEDIAQLLEENLSTVKSRLYRSIKKLRLQLECDA